jgi:excisionase family DNA binding protein
LDESLKALLDAPRGATMNELSVETMLTIRDASRRLNRCAEVVRRYVRDGKLPARKMGLMWYVKPEDVDELARRLDGRAQAILK